MIAIILQWIAQYWLVATIATVAVGAVVTATVVYKADNTENRTNIEVDAEKEDVLGGESSPANTDNSKKTVVPTKTLPVSETPWGQGPSDQTPSNGTLPSNQVPWGTGPSEQ